MPKVKGDNTSAQCVGFSPQSTGSQQGASTALQREKRSGAARHSSSCLCLYPSWLPAFPMAPSTPRTVPNQPGNWFPGHMPLMPHTADPATSQTSQLWVHLDISRSSHTSQYLWELQQYWESSKNPFLRTSGWAVRLRIIWFEIGTNFSTCLHWYSFIMTVPLLSFRLFFVFNGTDLSLKTIFKKT